MHIVVYVCLLLFSLVQGDIIASSIDEQCTFFVIKYKYTSKAIFQYVPTTIIDQTALNITADVNFYQSKLPCNQSFIEVINSFIMQKQYICRSRN
ncbi:unnamed protein product [Rotaria sordida]|uniref:Uncharacterized protein n=1 Tax=Rotaria sordida TaxID=392033 RepID=A0A818XYQ8_9BILA|nr:unnamed protein product [Rotaria sordida]